MKPPLARLAGGFLALALLAAAPRAHAAPDAIWVDGVVLTLDAARPRARALALEGARIAAVGSSQEMRALAGPDTRVVELGGRCVVPGFVDAHSHVSLGAGIRRMADLTAPPIGAVGNVEAAVAALRSHAAGLPADAWVVGFGYDDTLLAEGRHLDRADLDRVATDRPVLAIHVSGHLYAANGAALALAGIDRDTPDPPGGVIRRDPVSGEPDGVLEEMAAALPLLSAMPQPTRAERVDDLAAVALEYAARGVTTAQDGATGLASLADLVATLDAGRFPIRVVVLPVGDAVAPATRGELDTGGIDAARLHVGPVKLIADGSIQGFTGYLREPYHTPFRGDAGYRGYPTLTRERLIEQVGRVHASGLQLAIHGNGDAAIDDILEAFERALELRPSGDLRGIVIHAQMTRDDQLERMARLGVTPSFFALHTYYWGDRHRELFIGPERARRISPARSALDRGVRFSLHTDAPVVPMDVLRLMHAAANRRTSGGELLGPEQRIAPLDALRAVTLDAAWQYRLDGDRGSIEPGKLADLVVLSASPLDRPGAIDGIRVLETVVGGRSVYRAP